MYSPFWNWVWKSCAEDAIESLNVHITISRDIHEQWGVWGALLRYQWIDGTKYCYFGKDNRGQQFSRWVG